MNQDFILDSSLALSWCFRDEATPETDAVLDSLAGKIKAHVPALWFWEITNVIAQAERRRRINASDSQKYLGFLNTLPIAVEADAHQHAWIGTLVLARQHSLSIYDAAYLDLAQRLGLPLGTLDVKLQQAARAIGTELVS